MSANCLNELRDEALRIAKEHGFTDASPAEDFALMHSEISEALEDLREGKLVSEVYYTTKVTIVSVGGGSFEFDVRAPEFNTDGKLNKPCGIPSEIADIIIRALHFAGKHNIDIAKAVAEKMAYNNSRPYKHGKKL